MKRTGKLLGVCLVLAICVALSGEAFAADITLSFAKKSDYNRIDMSTAFMMVWSGDVLYNSVKVGEFNASLTKTTLTGQNGAVEQYDVVVPSSGPVGDFLSIRTVHSTAGNGYDQGIIFAASPALKEVVGATVIMNGSNVTITY